MEARDSQQSRLANAAIWGSLSSLLSFGGAAKYAQFVTESSNPDLRQRIEASENSLRHGPNTERTMFFSDAVFAIAMTLLALDLRVEFPEHATAESVQAVLLAKFPAFVGFVLSFFLVGNTWLTHHRRFKGIAAYDSRLQFINLALLMMVVFLPVPTSMLFEAPGSSPWPIAIYAITTWAIYFILGVLWHYAKSAGLLDPSVSNALYRYTLTSTLPVAVVFLLSIPIAFINPVAAMYSWILISPASIIFDRLSKRRFVRDETARFRAEDEASRA